MKLQRGKVSLESALQAIEQSDPLAQRAVLRMCAALGQAIAQMHLLVAPQRVVIAGPLAVFEEQFLLPLREAIERHLPDHHGPRFEVVGSQLGDFVGALGAAACSVHAWPPHSLLTTASTPDN